MKGIDVDKKRKQITIYEEESEIKNIEYPESYKLLMDGHRSNIRTHGVIDEEE